MTDKLVSGRSRQLNVGELLSRQEYLVVQGNDLAKAFGGLTAFEHKVLDYCFSMVKRDSSLEDTYTVDIKDILKHFSLNSSGQNYQRVSMAFKTLHSKTALYFKVVRDDGVVGITMAQLFSRIEIYKDGQVSFKFSEDAAPYVFDLTSNFYSFHLNELANIKSKYSLILLKLWESKRLGSQSITKISGSLDEWEGWFLGSDKSWNSSRFMRDCLTVAVNEISQKMNVDFYVERLKRGRKIVGYEITITDNRKRLR